MQKLGLLKLEELITLETELQDTELAHVARFVLLGGKSQYTFFTNNARFKWKNIFLGTNVMSVRSAK